MAVVPYSLPLVHVWFGDPSERELQPQDMYLAVYAAGGGKRNMANFVRQPVPPGTDPMTARFRTSDVHVFLSGFGEDINPSNSQLFICRWASGRSEWVPKRIQTWTGATQLKLVPEWFKARFWDNKQEKKHPWFMFALLIEHHGITQLFTSDSFPVHQYYPTGVKKTDPNDAACRIAFQKVCKQAPPTSLRPEHLLRNAAVGVDPLAQPRSPSPVLSAASSSATSSPRNDRDMWGDDSASDDGSDRVHAQARRRKSDGRRTSSSSSRSSSEAWGTDGDDSIVRSSSMGYIQYAKNGRRQRSKVEPFTEPLDAAQVDAAQALLALRVSMPVR